MEVRSFSLNNVGQVCREEIFWGGFVDLFFNRVAGKAACTPDWGKIDIFTIIFPIYNNNVKKHEIKKIKTCVNCRHLEILEEGQEVRGLEDTAYINFRCDVFNYSGKEVFRFPTSEKCVVIEKDDGEDCPFWVEWSKEDGEKTGSCEDGEEVIKPSYEPDEY